MWLGILIALFIFAAIIGNVVMWIISIVQIVKRKDFNVEKKALWAILCLIGGTLVSTIYFFIFGPKKLGWWTLVFLILFPIVMIGAAMMSFVLNIAQTSY